MFIYQPTRSVHRLQVLTALIIITFLIKNGFTPYKNGFPFTVLKRIIILTKSILKKRW